MFKMLSTIVAKQATTMRRLTGARTLSIVTLSINALSIVTFSTMKLSIKG
jgi:hypothetical protein